jgi:hypothetical protein
MSMPICPCCGQTTATETCGLCGWIPDNLNERGYSKRNRQFLSAARRAFMRELPKRILAAVASTA